MRYIIVLTTLFGFALSGVDGRAVETIEQRSLTDPVGHGNYRRVDGSIFRLHEVRDGLFYGIEPDEWDDEVHVKGDSTQQRRTTMDELDGLDSIFNPDDSTGHELVVRGDLKSTCRATVKCAKASATLVGTTLYSLGDKTIEKLKEVGPDVIKALGFNKPAMANFVGVGGQNLLVTLLFRSDGSAPTPSKPEECSTDMSQEDLMRALIRKGCESSPERTAFGLPLEYPDGSKIEFVMAAAAGDSLGDSDLCKAPKEGDEIGE